MNGVELSEQAIKLVRDDKRGVNVPASLFRV
jgi:hypothetical protein